jgi:redox-sensitive bicupin YhaK (pirin superfamily)
MKGLFTRVSRRAQRAARHPAGASSRPCTSPGGHPNLEWVAFGPLRAVIEHRLQPHAELPPRQYRDVEILTYVAAGILSYSDGFGLHASVDAGEMQLVSAGSRGMMYAEQNLQNVAGHHYQVLLAPNRMGTEFAYSVTGYTAEERQGRLRIYASPDGVAGSMRTNADASIYAGLFRSGDRVEHWLPSGRGAWVQLIRGRATVAGAQLNPNEGVGITATHRIDLIFAADSEALLFDVGMDAGR